MKKICAVLMLLVITISYANIWNTPDYSQTQAQSVETPVVEKEYYPVSRGGYYPGRPVRTAVAGAADTVETAAEGVSNVFHSDRPIRSAAEGAVDTADAAVEGAANVVRSIFN